MDASPTSKQRFPLVGILMIAAGVILFLAKIRLFDIEEGAILWGVGAAAGLIVTIQGFSLNRRGRVFWGSLLFFVSVYALIVAFRVLPEDQEAWFPHLSLAVGLSFFVLFLFEPRNIGLLVPMTLFCGIGALYYLWIMELVEMWEIKRVIRTYWPVVLILWGLALVFSRRRK